MNKKAMVWSTIGKWIFVLILIIVLLMVIAVATGKMNELVSFITDLFSFGVG